MLGKVGDAVMPRMRKPRPPKRYPRRTWQIEEDEYLAKWYNKKPVKVIARTLKRTVQSIEHRASRTGLIYVPSKLSLTMDDLSNYLGLASNAIIRRLSDRAHSPIPHVRHGRYVEIFESEFFEWLNAGNILSFERARLDPRLHRMHDAWRRKTITSTEVYEECGPLGEAMRGGKGGRVSTICIAPINQRVHLKDDVYTWAYQWGHIIPPWSSPRFLVIRDAWATEFVHKAEVMTEFGVNYTTRYISPHCPSGVRTTYKRSELCARLAELGYHDLAKRWRSTSIPWQELMRDYERSLK